MVPRKRAFIAVLLFAALPVFAATVRDDRGVEVGVAANPQRIIALSPHLAEIVYAAGAGAKLVAVVQHSDYPAAVSTLPQVGEASQLDIERILALKPDLILGWKSGNPARDLERIARMGLPLFVSEPRRLADIPRIVRAIGVLAGTRNASEATAAAFERDLTRLKSRYGSLAPVRVFYEIWHRPLLTVNGEHLISDVIALCGGRNVFADVSALTPTVSLEAVLAAAPDVILGGGSAMRAGDLESAWAASPVDALRRIPVRYVPPDLIQRQTPRMIEGARAICGHLDAVRKR